MCVYHLFWRNRIRNAGFANIWRDITKKSVASGLFRNLHEDAFFFFNTVFDLPYLPWPAQIRKVYNRGKCFHHHKYPVGWRICSFYLTLVVQFFLSYFLYAGVALHSLFLIKISQIQDRIFLHLNLF